MSNESSNLVVVGWIPWNEKDECYDGDAVVWREEECTAINEGWVWKPLYAAVIDVMKRDAVETKPNQTGVVVLTDEEWEENGFP